MRTLIEAWRTVPGFPMYEVSDQGRVRSHWGKSLRVLRPGVQKKGYLYANLCRGDGAQHSKQIHCLVMMAFSGERPDGNVIRHLNGNPADNRLTNLAYGTSSQNQLDAVAHGRHANVNKAACPQGHPYDAENTYVLPSRPSARYCRSCRNAESKKRRAARATQGASA